MAESTRYFFKPGEEEAGIRITYDMDALTVSVQEGTSDEPDELSLDSKKELKALVDQLSKALVVEGYQKQDESHTTNKFEGKSMEDLGDLFFEIGNENLVPELFKHIKIALKKFKKLQKNDEDLSEMIIVADIDERQFVFATGDGSDLESEESDCVFYIAKSVKFNDCMELIQYISYGNHPQGYLDLDGEVCHWVSDAMPEIDNLSVTIYHNSCYGKAEGDPVYESEDEDEKMDEDELDELTKLIHLADAEKTENLVPELSKHIEIALKKLQEKGEDVSEIIIVADMAKRQFVFAIGDGSGLENEENDCVFYIAKSDNFNECMKLYEYLNNHPGCIFSLDKMVYNWLNEAMSEIDDLPVTIYYNSCYGKAKKPPFTRG